MSHYRLSMPDASLHGKREPFPEPMTTAEQAEPDAACLALGIAGSKYSDWLHHQSDPNGAEVRLHALFDQERARANEYRHMIYRLLSWLPVEALALRKDAEELVRDFP
jgi:hypothetical protein